ncbi:MAG: hypothetical protein WCP08_06500 [Prolixibacteraceae bacterium]
MKFSLALLLISIVGSTFGQKMVSPETMQRVYETIKTPYKFGLVVAPENDHQKTDSPTVFRYGHKWYMTYIVFDGQKGNEGRGYETWLSESTDLLQWKTLGKILSFSDSSHWDCNQKAGYVALVDPAWNGKQKVSRFKGQYWISYIGGGSKGYETPPISIGIASTNQKINKVQEWKTHPGPVLASADGDASWWDNRVLYKSSVIWDRSKTLGHRFVMFYNAKGVKSDSSQSAERIGIALSDDMLHWKRYGLKPVLDHHAGITGDAQIRKMGDLWIMFYFGAFWKNKGGAFNRFACSYDLVHWTDWTGNDLVSPSESYDNLYAHKSWVVNYRGVIYHFYCAVNKKDQRGIAVATSKDLGKSQLTF